MELVVLILKIYVIIEVFILFGYTIRHFIFSFNRVSGEQRLYYQDILDSELPSVSVLVPMHNEEKVAEGILSQLIDAKYPKEMYEIIPINDHSTDATEQIIGDIAAKHPELIKPFNRSEGFRGKTHGLNDAIKRARGEIIIVFDADYLPPVGIVRDIAVCFKDPEVGAVMGRVIPINASKNFLTRLLDLERSGGYQVDQQARHNLKLIPQYGGTVGGFRKEVVKAMGGFDPNILTEDTELTYRLYVNGWKVVYANRAECYEEVPESWGVRARQIKRWARGHTQVMVKYLWPLLRSKYLTKAEKLDGAMLLGIYVVPVLILLGIPVALALFFVGAMQIVEAMILIPLVAGYSSFGNFAPFFQIGSAAYLDGSKERVKLLLMFFFSFLYNIIFITGGFIAAVFDIILRREPEWQKTQRYRDQKNA